jgi:2-haloacid dehalogenase
MVGSIAIPMVHTMNAELTGVDLHRRGLLLAGAAGIVSTARAATATQDGELGGAQQTIRATPVPSIFVFDVNETLIDIEFISPVFERIFGDRRFLREWFNQLILYSNAITLSGPYVPFFQLGQGILKMLAVIYGVKVTVSDIDELRTRMLTMPAHPDAAAGLKQLKEAGFRLVSFTNSPPDAKASPLKHAGLSDWFERSFSIDSVRRFKPAPQGYHMVAEELDVDPSSLCMVAAHVWDTIGAQSIGYTAALITRTGNAPLFAGRLPQPQIVAPDVTRMAEEAVRRWRK